MSFKKKRLFEGGSTLGRPFFFKLCFLYFSQGSPASSRGCTPRPVSCQANRAALTASIPASDRDATIPVHLYSSRRGTVNHVTQIYDEDDTVSPGARGT